MSKCTLPDSRAEEAVAYLKELQACGDPEYSHAEADKVLCELLRKLNFDEVVEEWEKVGKWYA